jgi:hypothetical protein
MQSYLKDVLSQLEHRDVETEIISSFGWSNRGFVLGDTMITAGRETPVLLNMKKIPDKLQDGIPAAGTVEEWVDLVDRIYNRPGAEPYQFLICAAFGAPLVQLVAGGLWHGIPIALTGATGLGKSTTCAAACSMFGPSDVFLVSAHEAGTTMNALIQRISVMHNLPLILDELHGMKGADLPTLLYALSNGVPKDTLRADRSFRDRGTGWNTLTFVTSNANINALLGEHDRSRAEATQVRVFEIHLPDDFNSQVFGGINAKELIEHDLLSKQFGYVGRKYLAGVAKHYESVAKALQRLRTKHIPNSQEASKERFFTDAIATAVMGGKLAARMGFIKFDVDAVEAWALKHMQGLRETRQNILATVDEQLHQILSAITNRTARTKEFPRGGSHSYKTEYIDETRLHKPIARLGEKDRVLVLTMTGFRELCREFSIDSRQLLQRIEQAGFFKPHAWAGISGTHGKIYPFRGTSLTSAGLQARCLIFDLAAMETSGTVVPEPIKHGHLTVVSK